VKAGQEFWGDPANPATLTYAAGTNAMFTDGGSAKANVKINNFTVVGFRGTFTCGSSSGWEMAYNDFTAENHVSGSGVIKAPGQQSAPVHQVHHNKFHGTDSPINVLDSRAGMLIADNEFTNMTGSEPFKVALDSWNVTMRHNWVHDITGDEDRGMWFDFWNAGVLIEWNLIESVGVGIEMEANPGRVGLNNPDGKWLTLPPFTNPPNPFNTIRYNYIRTSRHQGIRLHGSADHDIYMNTLEHNHQGIQTGLPDAEVALYINQHHLDPLASGGQGSDLKDNTVRYNHVTPMNSGVNVRAGSLVVQGGGGQPDPTPYVNNTKNNVWNHQDYHLGTLLNDSAIFNWNANKSWTQWQAVPQDVNSTAVA
jgi:hypothetical protein